MGWFLFAVFDWFRQAWRRVLARRRKRNGQAIQLRHSCGEAFVVARRLPDGFPGCDHCATAFLAEPVRLPILLCTPHYDDAAEILRETWRRKVAEQDDQA